MLHFYCNIKRSSWPKPT